MSKVKKKTQIHTSSWRGLGDEARLGESLASAKWHCDAHGLEGKGQPEDRWQANHVENESLEGECRGGDEGR